MEYSNLSAGSIRGRLMDVNEKIVKACAAAGRNPDEVTLLAVSKTKPVSAVIEALEAGQVCFGENYVQELVQKVEFFSGEGTADKLTGSEILPPDALPSPVWHMIGHLQRNKVKYIAGKTALIHSVDSAALADQIEKESAKRDVVSDILLEVNIAGEDTKWGFSAADAPACAEYIKKALPHVRLLGLMTSAPYTENPETNRVHFRNLKNLSDAMARDGLFNCETPVLSMGMTGDYEVAIQEGATIVRVGTGIFGERDYSKT